MKRVSGSMLVALLAVVSPAMPASGERALAPVKLVAQVVATDRGCDKYCWYTLRALRPVKDRIAMNSTLRVAVLSVESQLHGKCELELEPYNAHDENSWRVSIGSRPICSD